MSPNDKLEHNKKVILTYLKESGALSQSGNVYDAEKAFTINTVLLWCLRQVDEGKFDYNDVTFYMQSMNDFVEGNVNVYWSGEGNLVIGA